MSRTDEHVRLPDGRRLGYAEYGDPSGRPVLYFHGFPGSRLEAGLTDGMGRLLGARVIAPDRPGYGLSDFQPGRSIGDWPGDATALADALGIDRFAAVGVSGGGPFLLACAAQIPDRLAAAALVCPLGPVAAPGGADEMRPLHRLGFLLGRRAPGMIRPIFAAGMRYVGRNPERFVSRLAARLGEPDRSVLRRPEIGAAFMESFREGARSGPAGAVHELALLSRPWGFELGDVPIPVRLWHGELDSVIPPSMARAQERAIPRCRATYCPGEGHFSLPVNNVREILSAVIAPSKDART
jgi:pimeloyl-ACP methyl ester carboxylesterase